MVIRALLIIFSIFIATDLWANETNTLSKITTVTVFPDGALVKREMGVNLKKGENIIRIDDLPADLLDESIMIDIQEPADIRVSDIKVERTHLRKIKLQRIGELEERLKDINLEISRHTALVNSINASIDFLKKLLPFPTSQRVSTGEVDAFLRYMEKAINERYEKALEIENKIKRLKDEKDSIEKEISEIKKTESLTKTIFITVNSVSSKDAKMNISYMVNSAGWRPFYELRADSQRGEVEIIYSSLITQSTGEDWNNVILEVSSSRLHYGPLRDLTPWYVDVYTPPIIYKSLDLREAIKREESEEEGLKVPEVKEETTSFTFTLPESVSIPSDGRSHKVPLISSINKAQFSYISVPKLARYAYMKVDTKNPFQFPITKGEMSIYLDGRFTGKVPIMKQILSGEDLPLPSGIDESLRVEKRLIKKFTEYTGLVSKSVKHTYEYEIEIANGKKRDISLNVKDNIPVSRNEKIKVNLETPQKDEAEVSQDGIISWNLRLKHGEKKTLKIRFSVEYPRDLEITGLE